MTMLAERYRLVEPIGEGVSAVVWRALDTHTDSEVAVKLLAPHLAADELGIERFRREIQITRFLGHPQIVSIYDLIAADGRLALVMEHVPGDDLKRLVLRGGPLDVEAVVDVLGQTLAILAACHAKRVIHRDLKPHNVMRTPDGVVKLLDFGIARMTSLGDLTQTGVSLGSPEYMAPELFVTSTWDPRTDLYALGVIAFELLAGRPPFRGDSLPVLARQHLVEPVPGLRTLRSDVPPWLEQLVERLLAKRSHERYQSAEEVADDLRRTRVLACEVRRLAARECVSCGAQALSALPWCTACGHDDGATPAKTRGTFGIWTTDSTDPTRLREWTAAVLGAMPPATQSAAYLVGPLDQASGELMRRSAHRHGVVLALQRIPPVMLARRIGAWLLTAVFAFWTFGYFMVAYGLAFGSRYDSLSAGLDLAFLTAAAYGGTFAALAWMMSRVARRQVRRPLLSVATTIPLAGELAWLRELTRIERRVAGRPAHGTLSRMIEQYLLLVREGPRVDTRLEARLRQVLEHAAALIELGAELDDGLDAGMLARQATTWTALGEELDGETDRARRDALERRRRQVRDVLEQGYQLEDARVGLTARLAGLQSTFDRLLGKLLVLRAPLEAGDAVMLEAAVREARLELQAARAAVAALAEAA